MPALLAPPKPPPSAALFPRTKSWTVAEFHRVRSTGVWDGLRTYLLRGTVWEQGPMNPPHAAIVAIVSEVLRVLFGPGCHTRCQLPLVLGLDSDPLPDLAVVNGGPRDFLKVHPTTAELVVEVADTTLFEDTTSKTELYAEAGILEYWVVDVERSELLVFRDPAPITAGGFHYRARFVLTKADALSPIALPGHSLAVSDLLP